MIKIFSTEGLLVLGVAICFGLLVLAYLKTSKLITESQKQEKTHK